MHGQNLSGLKIRIITMAKNVGKKFESILKALKTTTRDNGINQIANTISSVYNKKEVKQNICTYNINAYICSVLVEN